MDTNTQQLDALVHKEESGLIKSRPNNLTVIPTSNRSKPTESQASTKVCIKHFMPYLPWYFF